MDADACFLSSMVQTGTVVHLSIRRLRLAGPVVMYHLSKLDDWAGENLGAPHSFQTPTSCLNFKLSSKAICAL